MSARRRASRGWTTYALAAACLAAIAAAILVVGPSNAADGGSGERLVTVARGTVQETVSGSGSVEAAKQLGLDFEDGGTLQKVYVKAGEHVAEGQLLAQLDPTDAQDALDDAEEALAEAESGGSSNTTAAYAPGSSQAVYATIADEGGAEVERTTTTPAPTETTPPETTTTPTPPPTATTPQTTTTPAPLTTTTPQTPPASTTPDTPTTTTPHQTPSGAGAAGGGMDGGGASGGAVGGGSSGGAGGSSGAGAASAASLDELQDAVDAAEKALAATKLRAPMAGTVASVGASAGEEVSGGASSGSGSGSGSSSGSGGSAGGAAGAATGAGASGSSSASSSSDAFIVLVDLDAMNLVVPFSESDVGKVRRGQSATVTVNALPDEKLAAHVVSVATLPSTDDGVVSYDVTLRLDQLTDGLKAGMTASASVVVDQADNVLNVSSSAVSGRGSTGTVTVAEGDERVQRRVTTGIVGDSTTQILDGLRAGDQLVVAAPPTSTAGAAGGLASQLGGARAGGGAFGGGGAAAFGGGGGLVLRGGPPGGGGRP